MFNKISWQNYWTILAMLVAVYYIIIYLLYFRNKISLQHLKAFKRSEPENKATSIEGEGEANAFDSCLNELATFFEEANGRKWIKEELLYALQKVLKKYSSLKNSSYEETIQRLTILQCKDICAVHINAGDLNQLWMEL
jgi:hypothetical protein